MRWTDDKIRRSSSQHCWSWFGRRSSCMLTNMQTQADIGRGCNCIFFKNGPSRVDYDRLLDRQTRSRVRIHRLTYFLRRERYAGTSDGASSKLARSADVRRQIGEHRSIQRCHRLSDPLCLELSESATPE